MKSKIAVVAVSGGREGRNMDMNYRGGNPGLLYLTKCIQASLPTITNHNTHYYVRHKYKNQTFLSAAYATTTLHRIHSKIILLCIYKHYSA